MVLGEVQNGDDAGHEDAVLLTVALVHGVVIPPVLPDPLLFQRLRRHTAL